MYITQKARTKGLGTSPAKLFPYYNGFCKLPEGYESFHTSISFSKPANGTESALKSRSSPAKERQRAERDQLIKVLKESPGKRDAKNFLKQFDTPKKTEPVVQPKVEEAVKDAVGLANYNAWRLNKAGVNLGNLYQPARAIGESPIFTRQSLPDQFLPENVEELHVGLVKLRQPQALDDEALGGIALTLSQMVRLGLNIVVVVDCDENGSGSEIPEHISPEWESLVREQATRIVDALEDFSKPGAFLVEQSLHYSEKKPEVPSTAQARGGVEVRNNGLLLAPLSDGLIPVIPPIAYTKDLQKKQVQPDDVILALTREFAGITSHAIEEEDAEEMCDSLQVNAKSIQDKPILDRIIVLDPLGGIPSLERQDRAHIFINLEAEYREVRKELTCSTKSSTDANEEERSSLLGSSNTFSNFAEKELISFSNSSTPQLQNAGPPDRHAKNLDLVHHALKLLPPSSSALIITPAAAAVSSQPQLQDQASTGVRTRRSKNPLIHNLLTDKPMVSSSLPATSLDPPPITTEPNQPTFLKKGIPVTIVPDPRTRPWAPPSLDFPSIELDKDPRIDFPRLVDLIDDSFRRKLDTSHYLSRIRGRVAGIIIAGNYEGGAICTWENVTPPPTSSNPNPAPLWVPYLDKFAVLTKSQGSGGVADIVWGALTRTAFPEGLVWRSRSSNPVNKWYFERSVGTWNLPGGMWTMFWTTNGVVEEWTGMKGVKEGPTTLSSEELTRWEAYVTVCQGVEPSWADGKRPD